MEGGHIDLEVPAGALEELGVLFVHCSFPAEVGGCVLLGQDQSPPIHTIPHGWWPISGPGDLTPPRYWGGGHQVRGREGSFHLGSWLRPRAALCSTELAPPRQLLYHHPPFLLRVTVSPSFPLSPHLPPSLSLPLSSPNFLLLFP